MMVQYDPPAVDREKADSIKNYAMWAKKGEVARAAILVGLASTLFDFYSSNAYNAELLQEKLDQTHNTNSQGVKKYIMARFLDFKLGIINP